MIAQKELQRLAGHMKGELRYDYASRIMYATDASVYREVPVAVARPHHSDDLLRIIEFARKHQLPLIPRAAGTSLAGQVVGYGLVVDVSKHMNRIMELNTDERWVTVQPGVILDDLNRFLKPYGLFFGPETSSSNRCMIGGMVGNNACGAHSLIYGSTRDHTLAVRALLSDGSEVEFSALSPEEFAHKCQGSTLESDLYRNIRSILSDTENQHAIRTHYPDRGVKRRNMGYALDLLLDCQPFDPDGPNFNFCRMLAGSEGTLAFFTEIKLNLVPLPPQHKALLCVHCSSLQEALQGNLVLLRHHTVAIELMDEIILAQTEQNIAQRRNRFFIHGQPAAILIAEFAKDTPAQLNEAVSGAITALREQAIGFAYPVVNGDDIARVWELRKAGLGVLSNMPGDAKPVAVIEDAAICPQFLPGFIAEFQQMLQSLQLNSVYFAHVATGELHLRPILNLKLPEQVKLFRELGSRMALLVKKYRGSLSGEHGDGRLRGEFLPLMLGEKNYALLRQVKHCWDPLHLLNPGKIVDAPPMHESHRYIAGKQTVLPATYFNFSKSGGILGSVEQCNGSADCRKRLEAGGTMCPSYMATLDEADSTRARANIIREFLTRPYKRNPFSQREIQEVLHRCLSCKACKSECPSNVDMAKVKAECLQQFYRTHPIPFRAWTVANISLITRLGMIAPDLYNTLVRSRITGTLIKRIMGFTHRRPLPVLPGISLRDWANRDVRHVHSKKGTIVLFVDEFTNYQDAEVGIAAINLLNALGYEAILPLHRPSGRSYLSKGLLRQAKRLASINVNMLADLVSDEVPLVGIEPSAILTFKDEYLDLLRGEEAEKARHLSDNTFMFDEFIMREVGKGNVSPADFVDDAREVRLHGHCHQKSLITTRASVEFLGLPVNYRVVELKTGCCGMAGSFGYERKNYRLSMDIGELSLFPAVRQSADDVIIAAPGTSCRQQISDGTGRNALHPIQVMYKALRAKP